MKGYIPGQLIYSSDMIILTKNTVDWYLISQRKQAQIHNDNICKNRNRIGHDYKSGDKVMLHKHTVYKYDTLYTGPFVIKQCFNNGTVNSKCGEIKITSNIRCIEKYKSDTKAEYINP